MTRLLIINPGSTSTKIGVYDEEICIFEETLRHSIDDISKFNRISEQLEFRKEIVIKYLEDNNIDISSLDGVVGRGGLLKPICGGTYEVTETMLCDLEEGVQGEHASNLGGIISAEIAKIIGKRAFIVDPVVVDEMIDVSRLSGLKEITRRPIWHALNQRAVSRRYAESIGKKYEELNLIVAHLGGGISVCPHKKGKAIDSPNALDGDGSFSPERAGALPVGDMVKLCFSGEYTQNEIKKMLTGKGGLVSYLGTNDARNVSERAENGDKYASLVYQSMAYQVSKDIGACAASLCGEVDQIILTGGLAYDDLFCSWIKERVEFIANITIYPGEDELKALADGGLRVLKGEETIKIY